MALELEENQAKQGRQRTNNLASSRRMLCLKRPFTEEKELYKMKKWVNFSGSVFSCRILISLVATLCLASVMLMDALPVFAASQLTVIIKSLGTANSANVLFRGQPINGQCVTTGESRIVGDVSRAGDFSVDFYSSNNCSGPRLSESRFSVQQGSAGGNAFCYSNTSCFFNSLTNAPNNQNDAIATVLIGGLGHASGANVLFRGAQQGVCITASTMQSGTNKLSFPLTGNGMFSVNFYSNTNCTGTRIHSFRYSAAQGSNGIFVGCFADTNCQSSPS